MRAKHVLHFTFHVSPKKKGSGTGDRGLALSYPGLPAPLDVNRSVSAPSLDVDCAIAQKQGQLRWRAAGLQNLEVARRLDGRRQTRLAAGTLEDRRCARNEGAGHEGLPINLR